MEAALRLVSENDAGFPWPTEDGELLTTEQAIERVKGLLYENEGLTKLTKKQAKENARLSKQIEAEADPKNHPRGKEMVELVEYWREATNHPNAKVSKDRLDIIKARLKDDYSVEQIRLAIDGIAAFPFVVNAQRKSEGKPSQRFDQLAHALKGGQALERFAVLGHEARKEQG